LRKLPAGAPTDDQAISRLLAYVPDQRSFYQAWADPSKERLHGMLVQTLMGESSAASGEGLDAPVVNADANSIGTTADLETHIDEPPARPGALPAIDPAVDALLALKPVAALQIQGTTETADRVFVVPQSTLVLQFAATNREAVEAVLAPALRALVFDGSASWQRTAEATSFGTIDPLTITAGVSPGVFLVSRGTSLADGTGANRGAAQPTPLTYAAGYNHLLAIAPYTRLFRVFDPKEQGEPSFFGNVGSLARSLGRLESIRIRGFEANSALTEEVVYLLK
jgi:hypothetical protein